MKALVPKTLAGQILTLVAIALFVAQAVNMVWLYRASERQMATEAAAFTVSRIARFLDRAAEGDDSPGFRGRRGPRPFVTEQSLIGEDIERAPFYEERAQQAFVTLGIELAEVRMAKLASLPAEMRGRRGVFRGPVRRAARRMDAVDGFALLSVRTPDGRWVNAATPVIKRNPRVFGMLLLQTIILYLVVMLPLLWLTRHISKPLDRLTARAEDYRPGQGVPLEPAGPPDTRQLISAFNTMQKRVDEMLGEKDVMLGAIGHDLRTPLATLRVRIENVEDEAERQKLAAVIEDMDRTLDDILSLARIGRSSEAVILTDMTALVETVVGEYQDRDSDVSFEAIGKIVAPVRATLIRRALRNLISNAIKYGGATALKLERDGDQLLLHVEDTGPGLPDEKLEAMFQPFVRGEKSRNRSTGGSGLGLTLARSIARDSGGDVKLANRAEGGLRATLSLPSDAASDRIASPK